jgi:hypothetical protein
VSIPEFHVGLNFLAIVRKTRVILKLLLYFFNEHSNSNEADILFSVKSEWMIGLMIKLNLTFPKVVAVKRLLIYIEGMLCPLSFDFISTSLIFTFVCLLFVV